MLVEPVPLLVPLSPPIIPSDAREVIDLWPALDERARRDLVKMARALARSVPGGNQAGSER